MSSNLNTILSIATFLEVRGVRKQVASAASNARDRLDLALREENERARANALRQTMFEVRVSLEKLEEKSEASLINTFAELLELEAVIDNIDARNLPEMTDKEYLLKLKRYASNLLRNTKDTLPPGTVEKFHRHEHIRVTGAPQTRAFSLACAALEYFPSDEGSEPAGSTWVQWLATLGVFFLSLNFASLLALIPALDSIRLFVFSAGFLACVWFAYKFHTRGTRLASVTSPRQKIRVRQPTLPSPTWLVRPDSIPRLEAMGQRMLFSETITKGLRGWRYAEMIASRDEAIRELQNTPDTLYDPSGILLTSEAAEARFHALITEMHNLARELNEVGVTKNQR